MTLTGVYYNELDPFAANWLRELMKAGAIPAGDIDERSIWDVTPEDVRRYRQAHFFAGIGGWAEALRLADWPDERQIWTGSCPCQPFSAAGKGAGFADERHLWPAWEWLIKECRPAVVVGEQVDKAKGWLDLVCADLEASGYAVGACDRPAASAGAPHIRQRLWFVAERVAQPHHPQRRADVARGHNGNGRAAGWQQGDGESGAGGQVERLAHHARDRRREERALAGGVAARGGAQGRGAGFVSGGATDYRGRRIDPDSPVALLTEDDILRGLALPHRPLAGDRRLQHGGGLVQSATDAIVGVGMGESASGRQQRLGDQPAHGEPLQTNPWAGCDWLPCRDGKSRPVEPGTFPLAHGVPARVGRLRGYGNAIVPQVAAEVLRGYLDYCAEQRVANPLPSCPLPTPVLGSTA